MLDSGFFLTHILSSNASVLALIWCIWRGIWAHGLEVHHDVYTTT